MEKVHLVDRFLREHGGDVGSGTRVRGGRVEKLFKAHIIVVGVAVVVSDTVPAKERRALTIGE